MLRVWTARLGSYREPDGLDVTRSGARDRPGPGAIFAPSLAILGPVLAARKAGRLNDAMWVRYVNDYTAEMRVSYREERAEWKAVLARDEVTLLCYCRATADCHRAELALIMGKLGAVVMGERPRPRAQESLFGGVEAR